MSLKHGDLAGTILHEISIDEFHPKTGREQDVIVIAFYSADKEPAEDLNTFIQRGSVEVMGVDVSPSTDQNGHYLIFVEIARDEKFIGRFAHLMRDIENLTGKLDWQVHVYPDVDTEYSIDDIETIHGKIITDSVEYIKRNRALAKPVEEAVKHVFENSFVTDLKIDGCCLTISSNGKTLSAIVEDAGQHEDIFNRNFLSESAFKLSDTSYEAKMIQHMTGNVQVLPVGQYLCLHNNGSSVLISHAQVNY